MSIPDLNELLARPSPVTGRRRTPEILRARKKELTRRSTIARYRAWQALSRLYPQDFEALLEQARAQVDTEHGSLPGDEP